MNGCAVPSDGILDFNTMINSLNISNPRVAVVGRNLDDLLPMLQQFPMELVQENPDLVITHGGDGTLLGAERLYPSVPKFPIRDRRNNPKCPLHDEMSLLESFFSGALVHGHLLKLVATTESGESVQGINDIVISRAVCSSAIRFSVDLDGRCLQKQVVADSLVISTPFGSTGYFQSITRGSFRCGLGLAYNNCMDGESFNVVPEQSVITMLLRRGPAQLEADNNPKLLTLQDGEAVRVEIARMRTKVFGLEAFRCHECYLLRRNGI